MSKPHPIRAFLLTFIWVALLAFFFSEVEIQIEGAAGWGANLPTWRIEKHWLLDLFWGGRAMTGYHAWVFPFIAMFFHFPFFFGEPWTGKLQARVVACVIQFWILEDFLWFVLNPAYGLERFNPLDVGHTDRLLDRRRCGSLFVPLFIPSATIMLLRRSTMDASGLT